MPYNFTTATEVPPRIISNIGVDILDEAISMIKEKTDFDQNQRDIISACFQHAINKVMHDHGKNVEGFQLQRKEAEEISDLIRIGKKVGAIKEFRRCTGADLRSSKEFIERFNLNGVGAADFLRLFI